MRIKLPCILRCIEINAWVDQPPTTGVGFVLLSSSHLWPLTRHHVHSALWPYVRGVYELCRYLEPVALPVVYGLSELWIEDVDVATEHVVRVVGWVGVRIVGGAGTVLPLVHLGETCEYQTRRPERQQVSERVGE